MKAEALLGVMSTFFRYSLKAAAGKTSGSSAQNLEESGALCGRDSRVLRMRYDPLLSWLCSRFRLTCQVFGGLEKKEKKKAIFTT